MKKILLTVLCISLLLVLPLPTGAGGYHCPAPPDAPLYSTSADFVSEPYSPTEHRRHGGDQLRCAWCDRLTDEENYFILHTFSGNTCVYCGYQRATKQGLNTEARQLISANNISNHACWVMYRGTLFSEADAGSGELGILSFGEQYYVNDYAEKGGDVWIQLKKLPSDSPVGWTLAEQLSIDAMAPKELTGYETGHTIRIIASSGRARTDAGTEFAYIETVHYGDRYTVLDAKIGSNGNTWYKIRVSGQEAWISSGLAEME